MTCTTCGMVYTKAQPDDEGQHLKFHKRFVSGLRFPVSFWSSALARAL